MFQLHYKICCWEVFGIQRVRPRRTDVDAVFRRTDRQSDRAAEPAPSPVVVS
jgi:hypothetical protein